MIEELLPDTVAVVEEIGVDASGPVPALHPEEAAYVDRAIAKRRREFALVRSCARRAMARLGVPPQPVPTGDRGAPVWPAGLLGSMTHCDGYGAAALVRDTDLAALGIDAEPAAALPEGVLAAITLPAERARLRRLAADRPGVPWDRLLFSAKESVYKAWFPSPGPGWTSPRPTSRSSRTRRPGPRRPGPRRPGPRRPGPGSPGPRHPGPGHAGPRHPRPRRPGRRHLRPSAPAPSSPPPGTEAPGAQGARPRPGARSGRPCSCRGPM